MATLATAESLSELKSLYRHYAAIHHPDKGGDHMKMQNLNKQYQIMKQRIKEAANDRFFQRDDFSTITVGCKLYVNNTAAEVIEVKASYFKAVAIGRSRQAVFDKATGIGRFNTRLKASFSPIKQYS